MSDIYIKNSRFLKKNAKKMYEKVKIIDNKTASIVKLKKGLYNIIKLNGNKEYLVHSNYNSVAQGQFIAKNVNDDEDYDIVFIFGMGLGYEVKEIIKKAPQKKYMIIEPDKDIFKVMLENINFVDFLNSNFNARICVTDNPEEICDEFSKLIKQANTTKIKFVMLPFYYNMYKNLIDKSLDLMKKIIKLFLVNTTTTFATDRKWISNYVNNIKYLNKTKSIKLLRNAFKNIPAIIVGAGPSLEDNLNHLKKINGQAIIVGAGNGVKVLEANNIKADIIGAMDGGELTQKIYDNLTLNKDSVLFYSSQVYNLVPSNFVGNKFLMNQVGMDNYINLKLWNENEKIMFSGPSITNVLAFNLSLLGCNPIIFLGQDLCGVKDKSYSKGTIYEKNKSLNPNFNIEIRNKKNQICYTNESFLTMKYSMEGIIKAFEHITYFNGTENGLHIEGSIDINFNEYVDKTILKNKVYNIKDIIIENSISNEKQICEFIRSFENEIKKIKELLENSIDKINSSVSNVSKLDYLNINEKELRKIPFYNMVLHYTFRESLELIFGDYKLIEKSEKIYQYYLEKCNLIEECIKLINKGE